MEAPKPPSNETLNVLSSGVDENMKLPSGGIDKFDPTVLERMAVAARELAKSGELCDKEFFLQIYCL